MELLLKRRWLDDTDSVGTLYAPNGFQCYTLEDCDRGLVATDPTSIARKVDALTAIPTGRYRVIVNRSRRFERDLPLLVDVPGFAGIRIHAGNRHTDTEGCILLGRTHLNDFRGDDFVGHSNATFGAFMAQLRLALKKGLVYLSVGYGRGVEDARSVKFPVPILEPHLPEKA
jgi:hypothetical protein